MVKLITSLLILAVYLKGFQILSVVTEPVLFGVIAGLLIIYTVFLIDKVLEAYNE